MRTFVLFFFSPYFSPFFFFLLFFLYTCKYAGSSWRVLRTRPFPTRTANSRFSRAHSQPTFRSREKLFFVLPTHTYAAQILDSRYRIYIVYTRCLVVVDLRTRFSMSDEINLAFHFLFLSSFPSFRPVGCVVFSARSLTAFLFDSSSFSVTALLPTSLGTTKAARVVSFFVAAAQNLLFSLSL